MPSSDFICELLLINDHIVLYRYGVFKKDSNVCVYNIKKVYAADAVTEKSFTILDWISRFGNTFLTWILWQGD